MPTFHWSYVRNPRDPSVWDHAMCLTTRGSCNTEYSYVTLTCCWVCKIKIRTVLQTSSSSSSFLTLEVPKYTRFFFCLFSSHLYFLETQFLPFRDWFYCLWFVLTFDSCSFCSIVKKSLEKWSGSVDFFVTQFCKTQELRPHNLLTS